MDKIWKFVSRQQAILTELLQECSVPPVIMEPPASTHPAPLQAVTSGLESDILSIAASEEADDQDMGLPCIFVYIVPVLAGISGAGSGETYACPYGQHVCGVLLIAQSPPCGPQASAVGPSEPPFTSGSSSAPQELISWQGNF
ncbi:UNVERIFIED_CONTAM: hypothetical protein FKN15_040055 [Acipenser sinensis]